MGRRTWSRRCSGRCVVGLAPYKVDDEKSWVADKLGDGRVATHVSIAMEVRGGEDRIDSGPNQGSRTGSNYSWGLVGARGNSEDSGNSMLSCPRWRSGRATSGIVAFPSTRGTKLKMVHGTLCQI